MKTKNSIKGLVAFLFLGLSIVSCEGYDEDFIETLSVPRVFAPVGITTKVSNQTTVELNWTAKEDVATYIVEFSADDPDFKTIFRRIENIKATDLPLKVNLEGETVYSVRIKGVSAAGLEESKWAIGKVTTLSEQIFLPRLADDVKGNQVTLRWPANSNVTSFSITPGNLIRTITAAEKTAGIATINAGLMGDTEYTIRLMNGTKVRGTQTLTTGVDVSTGTLVQPTDDLNSVVQAAAPGAVLILEAGTYAAYSGVIVINKPLTIRGLKSYDRPILNVSFSAASGASNINLIDLDFAGSASNFLTYSATNFNYGSLVIKGCRIQNYTGALISANVSGSKVQSVIVDNCFVKNVNTAVGADFIDFRITFVDEIKIQNSTFDSCSISRDFIRVDGPGSNPPNIFTGTGLTTKVLIDSCTLHNTSNIATGTTFRRILYLRFNANSSVVKNTLITGTNAVHANLSATNASGTTSTPTYTNNNYFNAVNFYDTTLLNNKADVSATRVDPGYRNAATADFTISNTTLKDNKVGDPRWR